MSQFALCIIQEPCEVDEIEFRPVANDQAVLQEASSVLFAERQTVVVPYSRKGDEISALFDEARDAVFNGRSFRGTQLGTVLPKLLRCCESIVLWWGSDWKDLAVCNNEEDFLDEVIRQLSGPLGDVYLKWQRIANTRA